MLAVDLQMTSVGADAQFIHDLVLHFLMKSKHIFSVE